MTADSHAIAHAGTSHDDGLVIRRVLVTPEMAREALETSDRNRAIKPRAITKYAEDMRAGNWKLNGETCKFEGSREGGAKFADGYLIDGQNRMLAIIEADMPVEMLVVYGVEEDSQLTIDSGVPRRFADYLSIHHGMRDVTHVASVTKWMYFWDQGVVLGAGSMSVSNSALSEYFTANRDEIIAGTTGGDTLMTRALMTITTYSTCKIVLTRVDAEAAGVFLEALLSGAQLERGGTILTLRNRLLADRVSKVRRLPTVVPQDVTRALVFSGWNAWRRGEEISRIILPKNGLTDKNYPFPQ